MVELNETNLLQTVVTADNIRIPSKDGENPFPRIIFYIFYFLGMKWLIIEISKTNEPEIDENTGIDYENCIW